MGIVTLRSWRVGFVDDEELEEAKKGFGRAEGRLGRLDREDVDVDVALGVEKLEEMRRRTSKSEPVGPREVVTSTVRGKLRDCAVLALLKGEGSRLTS